MDIACGRLSPAPAKRRDKRACARVSPTYIRISHALCGPIPQQCPITKKRPKCAPHAGKIPVTLRGVVCLLHALNRKRSTSHPERLVEIDRHVGYFKNLLLQCLKELRLCPATTVRVECYANWEFTSQIASS